MSFETSCSSAVTDDFNVAVSMLYSFWYAESRRLFDDVISREPTCCMAYYGAAMTFSHPIWDFISNERLAAAERFAARAKACVLAGGATDREAAYISTLGVYMNTTNPAVDDPATRLRAYADAVSSQIYVPYGSSDENAG